MKQEWQFRLRDEISSASWFTSCSKSGLPPIADIPIWDRASFHLPTPWSRGSSPYQQKTIHHSQVIMDDHSELMVWFNHRHLSSDLKNIKNQKSTQVNSPRGDPIIFCQFPQGWRFLLSSIRKNPLHLSVSNLPSNKVTYATSRPRCHELGRPVWEEPECLVSIWCLYGKWFDSLSPATPCNINIEHVRCDLMISASFFCFLFNGNNGMIYSCTSIP